MMKPPLKRLGRLLTAALSAVAIWSSGSLWIGTQQQAFAQEVGCVPVTDATSAAVLDPACYDAYKVSYFDVATAFAKSAGGYGGAGNSGGSGDALLRIVDAGNFETAIPASRIATDPLVTPGGDVCANIYVYNDVQEQQECCSCPLTPNELLSLSVINDLISNPFNPRESLSAGVIKIVGSAGACINSCTATTAAGPYTIAGGLHEWINHTETMASNQKSFKPTPYGFITSTSVDEFTNAVLDSGELANLRAGCHAIDEANSHASECVGICQCAAPPPTPTPPTPTPTATPTPTPPIILLGCKVGDNTSAGNTIITLTPATGVVEFDMAVIAIAYQSNTITVTPPVGGFTLISSTVEGDFTQNIYWHEISSSADDSWTFTFSASVQAEGGVLAYAGTCLADSTCPGGDPIEGSSALGQTGTTIQTGSSGIAVVSEGETVAMFGASEMGTIPFSPSGSLATECGGATNAGLLMSDKPSAPPSEGPFTATAPSSANVGDVVSIIPK